MSKSATDDALIHQLFYKNAAIREMVVHVLTVALRGEEFSAKDLPVHGEEQHGGPGIAGSVIRQLKHDGILAAVGTFFDSAFCPKITYNEGGNKIGVYRLANRSLALTLMERHGKPRGKYEQLGLFGTSEAGRPS